MSDDPRRAGQFCWFNLLSPALPEARAYFGQLLGWTYREWPGTRGYFVQAGEHDVGVVFDAASPAGPGDARPALGIMIRVSNADAAYTRVLALGGRARRPFDIGPHLRMATCTDPNGATFDVFEPRVFAGLRADARRPGVPSWIETFTSDPARATAFYTSLFGWTTGTLDSPIGPYTVFHSAGEPVAGLCAIQEAFPGGAPGWHVYFTVDDADAAARVTLAQGGRVLQGPRDVPGVGRMCGLVSPQGVEFRVMHYTSAGDRA